MSGQITVQSAEELDAVLSNPRFQPYDGYLVHRTPRPDGVIGELYGMRVRLPEGVTWR